MRLLITGAAGMVGREVVEVARSRQDVAKLDVAAFDVAKFDVAAFDHATLDITDVEAVRAAVDQFQPTAIINCAAFTEVDRCETEPDLAFRVNRDAAAFLADAAATVGARLVHVSTDYVFDGTKPSPYVETDVTNPQSVYGESKLAGELAVLTLGESAVVARTAWVFGQHGQNMVKTVLRVKDSSPTLRFVTDQRGSPTSAADLAVALVALAESEHSGVFHVTNAGAVSWFEFVREILRQVGDDPERVEPITTADLVPPRAAPRPANSVLDNVALRSTDIAPLQNYEAALATVLQVRR
jgi:dTDP-4-dehydrorhamnose reductase